MLERVELGTLGPSAARGRVCIDFTDPTTGRVKDRIDGENHVFLDSIRLIGWKDAISAAYMCLNDDATAIDVNMPYLRGQTVGYGRPSQGSLGTFRGAYNAANQILAQQSLDRVYWKFQYDFTPAQAVGTIRAVGLTRQYSALDLTQSYYGTNGPLHQFSIPTQYSKGSTVDGRYIYEISTSGVITKTDMWFGTQTTIDVSAIVGTGDAKTVGYNPSNGKYSVYVYSATPANRKMHVFTNSLFSTLEATYTCSNVIFDSTWYPLYFYGNYAYLFGYNVVYRADFVNNVARVELITSASTFVSNASVNEGYTGYMGYMQYGSLPLSDRYVLFGRHASNARQNVLDLSTGAIVAGGVTYIPNNTSYEQKNRMHYPLIDNHLPMAAYNSYGLVTDAAFSTYILPEAKEKTNGLGMTATYELEVYW